MCKNRCVYVDRLPCRSRDLTRAYMYCAVRVCAHATPHKPCCTTTKPLHWCVFSTSLHARAVQSPFKAGGSSPLNSDRQFEYQCPGEAHITSISGMTAAEDRVINLGPCNCSDGTTLVATNPASGGRTFTIPSSSGFSGFRVRADTEGIISKLRIFSSAGLQTLQGTNAYGQDKGEVRCPPGSLLIIGIYGGTSDDHLTALGVICRQEGKHCTAATNCMCLRGWCPPTWVTSRTAQQPACRGKPSINGGCMAFGSLTVWFSRLPRLTHEYHVLSRRCLPTRHRRLLLQDLSCQHMVSRWERHHYSSATL